MSLKPGDDGAATDDLELTIRFSASLSDLHLSIPLHTQPNANTSTLKQLIRSRLPAEYASRRIRLIYSGKALADDAVLSTILKRPASHPPTRTATPRPGSAPGIATPTSSNNKDTPLSAKAKGKLPTRDTLSTIQRIYIHCSIGDVVLSTSELADEAHTAAPKPTSTAADTTKPQPENATTTSSIPPPTPALRGFDRLLTSGFTPTEISSLRMQFLAIQAHTHTPDDMPSPDSLRELEDQWLDNSNDGSSSNAFPGASGSGAGETAGLLAGSEEQEGGALDDMIYGTAMGFFWPLGCLMWAFREQGIWSARRRMAVVVGVVLNVGLGVVRVVK